MPQGARLSPRGIIAELSVGDDGDYTYDEITAVVDLLYEEWNTPEVGLSDLTEWVMKMYDMDDDWVWRTFMEKHTTKFTMMNRLNVRLEKHGIVREGGDTYDKFQKFSFVLCNIPEYLLQSARILVNMKPESLPRQALLSRDASDDMDVWNQNVLVHNDNNFTNFQRLILHLRKVLESLNYRRADGKLFEKTLTKTRYPTFAFQEVMTIKEFVAKFTNYMYDLKAWNWSTNPSSNFSAVIDYMKTRPLPEAPDLEEKRNLRSYEGDCYGRGAGVYDSSSDMFFPYDQQDNWSVLAANVTESRRRFNSDYVCTPPGMSDVCVTHLNTTFPYNIYHEMMEDFKETTTEETTTEGLNVAPLHAYWRYADEFECSNKEDEITTNTLVEKLTEVVTSLGGASALRASVDYLPPLLGYLWVVRDKSSIIKNLNPRKDGDNVTPPPKYDTTNWLDDPDMLRVLKERDTSGKPLFFDPPLGEGRVTAETWIGDKSATDSEIYVSMLLPQRRVRAKLPTGFWEQKPELRDVVVTANSFVRIVLGPNDVLFLKIDKGRTSMECPTPDIDHIYTCQKFTDHDKFMLYALKGRLFFQVGERDRHQMCFMLEGIGGCGKSTILTVQMSFWPPHLRGVLSSNIQAQFGVAAVAKNGKAMVVFCNEVASDLNLLQEEWQTMVSGEWGSFAIKFEQDPLVLQWTAQQFWVGNTKPLKFKNTQGQVSRRLAGVLMPHPVKPRDGNIIFKMKQDMGHLQRREILAYEEFLAITGSIDPMSLPNELPPAFAEFYRAGRRATDPIEDFLSNTDYILCLQDVKDGETDKFVMLMKEFRELYGRFRMENELGRSGRWSSEVYRTPFNDRGIKVVKKREFTLKGVEYTNVDIIYGLMAVQGHTADRNDAMEM